MVGSGTGVAAGPEPIQQSQAGEGAQSVLGGVEVMEGELGELVAGEYSVFPEQSAQLAVAVGEPTSQRSCFKSDPIGPSLPCSTAGSRHPVHRW